MATIYNSRVQALAFFRHPGLLLSILSFSFLAQANEQNLVTILLPAPTEWSEAADYPRLTIEDGHQDLRVHEQVFQAFGLKKSHRQIEAARIDYARMRGIGFRIDPCFRFVSSDRCQPQLRVVWQAFTSGIADDVALHSFHRIGDSADFQSLLSASRALDRSGNSSISLVHPHFLRYGTRELRSQAFLQVIRRLVAIYPAHEIAVQTLEDDSAIHWGFLHFRVREGQTSAPLLIQKLNVLKQTFQNWARPTEFISALMPDLSPIFGNREFLKNSTTALAEMPISERRRFRNQVERVMDARQEPFHGNVDCVSCHIAPAIRDVLDDRSGRSTVRLRMLGYHRSEPVISDRVKSESARILSQYSRELNAN